MTGSSGPGPCHHIRRSHGGTRAGQAGTAGRAVAAERVGGAGRNVAAARGESEDVKDAGAWEDRNRWADWIGWDDDVNISWVANDVYTNTHGRQCRIFWPDRMISQRS